MIDAFVGSLPDVLDWQRVADIAPAAADMPEPVRWFLGAVGLLLVLWGARLYKPALRLASFAAGGLATWVVLLSLTDRLPVLADPWVAGGACLIAGVLVAWAVSVAHRIALIGVGLLVGLTLGAAAAAAFAGGPAWALGGAVVGALTLPWVFDVLLGPTTAFVGAVLVLWAFAMPTSLPWLGALTLVGTLVQLFRPPRRASSAREA